MQVFTNVVQTVDYMHSYVILAVGLLLMFQVVITVVCRLYFHELARYPGHFLAKISDMYGSWHSLMGRLHIEAGKGHREYGPIFRQGANKIVFNTETALHTIYNSTNVRKSQGYKAMLPSPGAYNTFMSVDRRVHRRKCKVMTQGLTDQCIRPFEPKMLAQIRSGMVGTGRGSFSSRTI